eukprot:s1200_g29.t1
MVWAPEADGFYVFGGWGDGGYSNKLHFYDRQANQWIEVTPAGTAPTERSQHAAVWVPTAHGFYVSGGGGDPADRGWLIDVHFYDRQANQWSEVTPGGTLPDWRAGHTMVWASGADGFYIFGGYGGRYMNELHFFDRQKVQNLQRRFSAPSAVASIVSPIQVASMSRCPKSWCDANAKRGVYAPWEQLAAVPVNLRFLRA